jgi:hypothetical protein
VGGEVRCCRGNAQYTGRGRAGGGNLLTRRVLG